MYTYTNKHEYTLGVHNKYVRVHERHINIHFKLTISITIRGEKNTGKLF